MKQWINEWLELIDIRDAKEDTICSIWKIFSLMSNKNRYCQHSQLDYLISAFLPFLFNKVSLMQKFGKDWRDGSAVKNTAFPKNPNLILNICVRWLTTACNASSRASDTLLLCMWAVVLKCFHFLFNCVTSFNNAINFLFYFYVVCGPICLCISILYVFRLNLFSSKHAIWRLKTFLAPSEWDFGELICVEQKLRGDGSEQNYWAQYSNVKNQWF